ncbi:MULTISPECIES: hypothetical protein [unclassified Psychrobacter]|uniref:hypothetical protein n=1 Tax=unclassified Psychrobacter TaxID=196806 RepID=UPI0018F61BC5|nr:MULTISPECIES: hypothetical protein [unclassified Psychrobacter]
MINTPYRDGIAIPLIVAAGVTIAEGELVATDSDGHAVPASNDSAKYLMGRAETTVEADDTQTNATITITRNRQFLLSNDATNPVTAADIGKVVVLNGKNTVAKPVEGGSADALGVGVLMGVDYSGKVWVDVGGAPIGIVTGSAGDVL